MSRQSVVFVHGAGADHTVWRFQTRWLANRGYQVLAPDLPGHGAEPGPALASIEQLADWVAALLPADGAVVVGHSMGAFVAIETAVRNPDTVRGVVLVGAAPRMAVNPAFSDAAGRNDPLAAELLAAWSFPPAHTGDHPEPGTWEAGGLRRLVRRSRPGVLATDLAACEAYPGADRARQLGVETWLVSGERDRMASVKGARELSELIAGSRLVTLAETGHQPMVSAPRRFNQVLDEFLTSPGKPAGQ